MEKKISLPEWIEKNCKGLSKQASLKKCSSGTGRTVDTCRRAWNTLHTNKKSTDVFKGLNGFAELHDIDARQRRRDIHCTELIKKFIEGPLKERGWYYDSEAARVCGITSVDWARHRDSYSDLQVLVSTEKGKRLTWVHPSLVDQARQIAERS